MKGERSLLEGKLPYPICGCQIVLPVCSLGNRRFPKEKAKLKQERERKSRCCKRETIEAAQRSRRIYAAEGPKPPNSRSLVSSHAEALPPSGEEKRRKRCEIRYKATSSEAPASYSSRFQTLLAFVNFKLYHSINVKYPPILDPRLEALAADLYALSRYFDANSKVPAMESQAVSSSGSEQGEAQKQGPELDESELRLAQLQRQLPSNEPGALMHLVEDAFVEDEDDEETKECKTLFKNMKFFLSREVPRESLLFVIPAFGGVVSWYGEGAPFNESDQSITHQIVDRPTQGRRFLSREYVRPQWLYDCVNARIILPVEEYLVGRVPPPHLSPFVDNEAEGYVPEYAETIRLQATARKEVLSLPGLGNEDLDDPQNLLVEGIISRTEAIEAVEKKQKADVGVWIVRDGLGERLEDFDYFCIIYFWRHCKNKHLETIEYLRKIVL
ncbi:pescadillo homolog [Actinidia eriantha]|uniref:pescadillo homolog n=1 Tax=Actinidia eriantha TaxID=165200 RepID=UPI0025883014|nr:pescadillo homolog [Actinidia eriantha]